MKLMGGDFVSMLDVEADACDVVVAKRLALAYADELALPEKVADDESAALREESRDATLDVEPEADSVGRAEADAEELA